MVIKASEGPAEGRNVLKAALTLRKPRAQAFTSPLGGAPQMGSPVAAYRLSLSDLRADRPLDFAKKIGWRYPIVGGGTPGLADIRESEDGHAPVFGGMSHGVIAQRLLMAAMLAEKDLAKWGEDLEPRLLEFPALHFAALWLHGNSSDFFVSLLEGRPPGTAEMKIDSNILPELRDRAIQGVRRNSNVLGGGGGRGAPTN